MVGYTGSMVKKIPQIFIIIFLHIIIIIHEYPIILLTGEIFNLELI